MLIPLITVATKDPYVVFMLFALIKLILENYFPPQ